MSLKQKKEKYEQLYGDIPTEEDSRMNYLLELLKFRESELPFIKKMGKFLKNIKTKKHTFILYLIPEPTPRPRLSGTGTFYVKGAKDNYRLFTEIVKAAGNLPIITTATKLDLISYLPTPKSMNRFEKYFAELGLVNALSIPDWDNLAKTYSDMIQKNLILNDNLIYDGRSRKFYSIKPRIELTVEYQLAYDCTYNRKKVESSRFYMELYEDEASRFCKQLDTVLDLMKKGET